MNRGRKAEWIVPHGDASVLEGVRKIAVLRANAIGDFVFALPALEALRRAYPQAEIIYLGQQWHAEFLQDRPGPWDRVEVVPAYPGVWDPPGVQPDRGEQERFFTRMQAEHFDLALQMHGGGANSNPFVLRLGARTTAGLCTPDAVRLDRWMPYIYFQAEHLRYVELVSLVGARQAPLEPRLAVTAADHQEVQSVLPPAARPLALLHPGAGDPRRRWPPAHFAAVADALDQAGAQVAFIGIREVRELADRVLQHMSPGAAAQALNLCGQTSLGGLMGLLARAALVVSNDSGPLHLALAAGVPTVGIYWCGNLFVAGPPTRSLHRPAISWRLECPLCGADITRTPCEHRTSFVADVPPAEVTASALELLHYEPAY